MTIKRFEDIECWKLARELTRMVYTLAKGAEFARDFALRDQITRAAGSSMHNIAEGFDAGTNPEFIRFLRFSKRSSTEVQSQLYVALDQEYITQSQFDDAYEQARLVRAKAGAFIHYLSHNRKP